MPAKNLTPAQIKKQKEGLAKFHENENKPTSANSIKEPRAINNVRRKFSELSAPSAEIISKAIKGDLVPEKSIWMGDDKKREEILNTNPSASFEWITLDNGKEVEVLIEYTSVSPKRIDLAKWILTADMNMKKAAEDSKLKKLEIAMKDKKAKDEGAIPKETIKEKVEEFGKPRLVLDYDETWDEDQDE